ncbi:MAG: hypothetical protein IJX70_03260 [Clostridia bacterium]|nr:hypothetical protein [Clostridia bacterium]
MNITFLIGNGFDVGMGLKSKFSDYFPIYIKESEKKDISIKALADDIDTNRAEWSYFEKKLGEYTEKFTPKNQNDFFAQLRDFELGFIYYLTLEQGKLEYNETNIKEEFTKALRTYYGISNLADESVRRIKALYAIYDKSEHIYNFINFNYTNVLDRCIWCITDGKVAERRIGTTLYVDKIGKVENVHGFIGALPLMGLNDESQIKNKELANDIKFRKRIIKPLLNAVNRTNNDTRATQLINNSQIICIYGMSLGETDKKWWQLLLKWIANDGNRQLIIFDYDENYTESSQFDWINKQDSILDLLANYAKEPINIESISSRIHIAVHKNIFAFNLRKQEYTAKGA